MPSDVVLFMGMVRRGEYESLLGRGLPLGVLVDTNNRQRLADVSNFTVVERFDFSRPLPDLIEAVSAIRRKHGLNCLFNVIELYVAQTADVAAALGIPGISPASARLCLDKNAMRERFRERLGSGVTAQFQVVQSEDELIRLAGAMGYPVFLQPNNVSASMWSSRNNTPEALRYNYRAMRDEVPKYYEKLGQKDKTLSVVLAEYLDGRNASVDCLVDKAGRVFPTPVVDVLTGQDVGIDDFHHFARVVPSRLDATDQSRLTRLAAEGVTALDMTSTAAHVEFIGPRLGEIAARPGGNRPRILDMAYGIDELSAYFQVLNGRHPEITRTRNLSAAILTPFPSRNGTLRAIRHLDRIVKLPGYVYHEIRGQPGQPVGLAKNGCRAPLYIELLSEDAATVHRGVDRIASWADLYVVE